MTPEQMSIAKALGNVTYLPASFDKRMGLNMSYLAHNNPDKEISEKQNEWLYRLLYKYRKQIPNTYQKFKDNLFCNRIKLI